MTKLKYHFSVLAGYPSWYCYYLGNGYVRWDEGDTHRCCDQYENDKIPGVKYSGSWDQYVCAVFILQSALFLNCQLVVQ